MDQLDAIRVFLAVASAGSLSAAARRLGLPVATVSRRIAALEKHVGARLVSRTTRRMALTDAGARYREACARIVAELEAAEREITGARDELSGPLVVTAPVMFGRLHVVPVVAQFLREHPRVDVRLLLGDRNAELIDEGIDVAVRIGALPDSALVAVRVGSIRRIVCASPEYLRARGTPESPEALAGHDCIAFSGIESAERWLFRQAGRALPVGLRPRLVVTTADAALEAALAGVGVTRVLSYQAAAGVADGRLVPLLERFEPPAVPATVLHREGRTPRPKVKHFVSLAAARLRAALAGVRDAAPRKLKVDR
ncbi:MAG TPA: LysR substrate-binding domain-containing protein [Myxococcota bacterium]|nr:LysR substrate-binding domain-containing protein [Myxococcota bacterium]